jgi:hypothetical protein
MALRLSCVPNHIRTRARSHQNKLAPSLATRSFCRTHHHFHAPLWRQRRGASRPNWSPAQAAFLPHRDHRRTRPHTNTWDPLAETFFQYARVRLPYGLTVIGY